MAKQASPRIWLTYLGQTDYENLNPYWAFCESGADPPHRLALLHTSAAKAETARLKDRFSLLSEQYLKDSPIVETIPFNDEDVGSFREKAEAVFQAAAAEKTELIIDVSPTTWSYVPIFLMKLVWANRPRVRSVVYFQYAEPAMRRVPYPLIPRKGLIRHDLLTELSDSKESGK